MAEFLTDDPGYREEVSSTVSDDKPIYATYIAKKSTGTPGSLPSR